MLGENQVVPAFEFGIRERDNERTNTERSANCLEKGNDVHAHDEALMGEEGICLDVSVEEA